MMRKIKVYIIENFPNQSHSSCATQGVCGSIDSKIHAHPPGYMVIYR